MSTYSPSLRIQLINTGDQAGTWGNTTNVNMGTLIESAIAGYTSVSITSANQALTALDGAADQSRNMTLALTTTTAANFNVYAPPAEKTYVIDNTSAYTATIYNSTVLGNTTAAGTGVAIPAGRTVTVWSDGTNFLFQNDHLDSLTLATDLAIADGGTGASTAANARTNLGVTATGADTTYAFRANNLSDLASASSARTNLGLGSIATQNANSVSITGGSITGITDLAVADGGTGASDASGARTNLGLGSIATQNANSVSITGGSITGITDLAVADGGTGASDAATARSNLGLVIGTNVPSPTGGGASGTWGINISGNAATATNATNATNPASGGSFITSSNIGSQSVAFATNATNATNSTFASNPASGGSFITSSNIGGQSVNFANSASSATNATNATNASTVTTITTNQVLAATAGAAAFAVGAYVVALNNSLSTIDANSTIAGSSLGVADSSILSPFAPATGLASSYGTALSGTWRAMVRSQSRIVDGCGFSTVFPSFFLRVS